MASMPKINCTSAPNNSTSSCSSGLSRRGNRPQPLDLTSVNTLSSSMNGLMAAAAASAQPSPSLNTTCGGLPPISPALINFYSAAASLSAGLMQHQQMQNSPLMGHFAAALASPAAAYAAALANSVNSPIGKKIKNYFYSYRAQTARYSRYLFVFFFCKNFTKI